LIRTVEPISRAYRSEALHGIDREEVEWLRQLLIRITENCERAAAGSGGR
jgi:hypothetical protein